MLDGYKATSLSYLISVSVTDGNDCSVDHFAHGLLRNDDASLRLRFRHCLFDEHSIKEGLEPLQHLGLDIRNTRYSK